MTLNDKITKGGGKKYLPGVYGPKVFRGKEVYKSGEVLQALRLNKKKSRSWGPFSKDITVFFWGGL